MSGEMTEEFRLGMEEFIKEWGMMSRSTDGPTCKHHWNLFNPQACPECEKENAMSGETQYPMEHESDRKVPRYDTINPPHYRAANGMESIDVIEAFVPDKPHRWAALKYIFRAGKKPGQDEVQDLRKAIWWLEREIASLDPKQRPISFGPAVAPPFGGRQACVCQPGVCENAALTAVGLPIGPNTYCRGY